MLLRTRIMLLAGLTVSLVVAGLAGLGAARERLLTDQFAERVLKTQATVWHKVLAAAVQRMETRAVRFAQEPALRRALADNDRGTLTDLAAGFLAEAARGGVLSDLQVSTLDGQVRFTSIDSSNPAPAPLVDGWPLRRLTGEAGFVSGLRQTPDGRLVAVYSFPIRSDGNDGSGSGNDNGGGGRMLGVATFARPIAGLLPELGASLDAMIFLLDRTGALIDGTHVVRWPGLKDHIDRDAPRLGSVATRDHVYSIGSQVLADIGGGRLGYLVIGQDVTEADRRVALVRDVSLAAAVVLVLLGLGFLYAYLRQSFAPLGSALGVIDGLSRGEEVPPVEAARADDEIGKLTQAIAVFRENAITLARAADEGRRRRHRQERFIRSQMQALAATLDKEPREALLQELVEIERTAGAGPADGLGVLAVAFQRMSQRVGEQHSRLAELVVELREALYHKTQLISLQQELDIARKIQLSILPQHFPERPEVEIFGRMMPAKEVGGDFYDFFLLDAHRLGVAVADVSGKGIPAAFFMLIARTLLKATATFGASPGACLSRLNDLLGEENEQMLFVTLFYGILDLRTGAFTYANGGHNPPYHLRAGPHHAGTIAPLASTEGMGLAVIDGLTYRETTLVLAPGDGLLLYSDGVTEAFDIHEKIYGDPRLIATLAAIGAASAQELVEQVFASVLSFAEGAPQADDITTVGVRYLGPAGE